MSAFRFVRCLVASTILLSACGSEDEPPLPLAGSAEMEKLVATACARCHTVPPPSFLSQEEWPYLLAWMGEYLGHRSEMKIDPWIVDRSLIPPEPVVTRREFEAIRNHYLEEAAEQYEAPPVRPRPEVTSQFEPVPFPNLPSVITMVGVDPTGPTLFVGSSVPPRLHVVGRGSRTSVPLHTEAVTYERIGDRNRISLMGHFGNDAGEGQVADFDASGTKQRILVNGHPRVVDHRTADIDGDGYNDLLVCGFGEYSEGRVGIYWGNPGEREQQVLLEESGTSWAEVVDLNDDGRLDVIMSVANARPRLLAFLNEGDRSFRRYTLVDRPVGWGYNRCLLVDWNNDGRLDIVELTGNNLELGGRPVKAHHGIRVLLNRGDLEFEETLFEPLPGAMDVAAADFTGNGMTDLAVTAFTPDWRAEIPTTFLLLLQDTDGTVERAGIADRYWNRWLRVTAADATGDGRVDLVLGAAQFQMGIPDEHRERYDRLREGRSSVLLLRNRGGP